MKSSWQSYSKRASKIERTSRDGDVFDSKTELKRWEYLRLLQRIGDIKDLQRQVPFALTKPGPEGIKIMAGGKVAIYTPDFCYKKKRVNQDCKTALEVSWDDVIEDVKGYRDEASKFRIRVFEALYNFRVTIVRLDHNRWITE